MHPPILIAAPGRSGTTMLAWLLHLHGVWIGDARPTKSPETNPLVGTENTAIKRYIRAGRFADFHHDITAMVPTDGRWLVKTAGLLHTQDHWRKAFPKAWWLCPQRPIEDIVRSRMEHPGTRTRGEEENRGVAVRQINEQNRVLADADQALAFAASDLCRGGETGEQVARRIFDFVGIGLDPAIYHGWVQPKRWHGEYD